MPNNQAVSFGLDDRKQIDRLPRRWPHPFGLPKRLLPRTIRGHILLLLFFVAFPWACLESGLYHSRYETRQDQELQANLEIARAMAVSFEGYVQDVLRQESTLALTIVPSGQLDVDKANRTLASAVGLHPSVRQYSLLDPRGQVIASSRSELVGSHMDNSTGRDEIVNGREWAVSNLTQSRSNGEPTFVIARGIRDDRGNLLGILGAMIDPRRLGEVIKVQRAGQAAGVIIDGQGRSVYRYPEVNATWEQRDLLHVQPIIGKALAGEEVTDTFLAKDNQRRMGGYTPISSIGWVASASRVESEVIGPLTSEILQAFGQDLLVIVSGIFVALLIGRRITTPIRHLREHAAALGRGEPPRRDSVDGPVEIEDLASTFERMAEQMRSREDELRVSEQRFRVLAENAHDVVFRLRLIPRPAFEYVSPSSARLTGYTPDELYANPTLMFKVVHPDDRQWLESAIHSPGPSHTTFELRWIRKDGSVVWAEQLNVPVLDREGNVVAVQGIARDVTARKHAEQQLKASEERYKNLVELTSDVIYISDAEGNQVFMNDAGIRILEASADEVIGQPWSRWIHPDDRERTKHKFAEMVRQGTDTFDFENRYLSKSGRAISVLHNIRVLRDEDGANIGVQGIARDITQRKHAEQLRDEYLSLVSHDLRSPLTVVSGQAEWLRRLLDNKGLTTEAGHAGAILKSAKRMNVMIRDLVESARLESGSLEINNEPTDLVSLVSDISDRVGTIDDRDRIHVECPDPMPLVFAGAAAVERAVVNLVTNALKYSPPGSPVMLRLAQSEGAAVISVIDHGDGISPHDLAHIFDRFYRAESAKKAEGLGLGLYITRLIVESHGGRLWAESAVGVGSTFHLTLPLAPVEPSTPRGQ